jgi:hypothetical protein
MSLSSEQQSNIINANVQLTTLLNSLTSTTQNSGQDALNISIAAAYNSQVKILSAISAPVASYKIQISNALGDVTTSLLNSISDAIDILSTNVNTISLPSITENTIQAISDYNTECINFESILPNAMASLTTDQSIPLSVSNSFKNSLIFLKYTTVNQVLASLGVTFMTPIQTYIEFLSTTDIANKIYTLQNFERCLLNPNAINRPREELFYPGTTQYNSQYFLGLFSINVLGKIQYGQINPVISNVEDKLDRVLTKIYNFIHGITSTAITIFNFVTFAIDTFTLSENNEYNFTLSQNYIQNSELVIMNGVVLTYGIDYTIVNNILNLDNSFNTQIGWEITVKYAIPNNKDTFAFDTFTLSGDDIYNFTLSQSFVLNSELVVMNGVSLTYGIDYNIIDNIIELDNSFNTKSGWEITVKYAIPASTVNYIFDTFTLSENNVYNFTLSQNCILNSEIVIMNGEVLTAGIDYNIINNIVQLDNSFNTQTGWEITIKYAIL